MKLPNSIAPVIIYTEEIPVPFYALGACQNCPRVGILFFPVGRSARKIFQQATPCDLCGKESIFFSSPVVTAN